MPEKKIPVEWVFIFMAANHIAIKGVFLLNKSGQAV